MAFPSFRQSEDARLEDVAALGRVAFAAGTAPDVESLMTDAGREVADTFGAAGIALYVLDAARDRLLPIYRSGSKPEHEQAYDTLPASETLAGRVALDGIARSWLLEDYPPRARAAIGKTPFLATASVPLKVRARVVGALNVGFTVSRRLAPDRLNLLEVMAAHFAEAIEAQRTLAQVREVSAANAVMYEELRTNAAELSRARAELAEKARLASLGELSAVIAHELRNPLAVLSNVLSLLLPTAQHADAPELGRAAREELSRMNALVTDLLEFARPAELAREPVSVEALLQEIAQALHADLALQAVQVEVQCEPALPLLQADPRRLRQALLNLAQNGAQAMRGTGRLRLHARRGATGLRVEVADDGPGIPPEIQARLFQPFFTTKPTGTGLGLALVQRVVRQHGGQLGLVSEPGRGTTFVLELPAEP